MSNSKYVTKPIPDKKSEITRVTRPWGNFSQYANNEEVTVSLMKVKPDQCLSRRPTVRVFEVAFGNWQQEDITRYEGDYNRPGEGE